MIFILEDNEDRVRGFRAVAATIAPGVSVRVWRSAHEMLDDLVDGLEHALEGRATGTARRFVR
jgi:hypothetical protein